MEHWHRSGTALLDEIAATHLPASQLAVWYIGQCGFLFKCGETTFCIDPVLSDLTGPNGSRRRYPAPRLRRGSCGRTLSSAPTATPTTWQRTPCAVLRRTTKHSLFLPSGCRVLAQ